MMHLVLLTVGKSKKESYRTLEEDYLKRLSYYLPTEMSVVRDSSQENILQRNGEEGKKLLEKIKPGDFVVVCDETGKPTTSVGLAGDIKKWRESGLSRLVFIVGGAYGLSEAVKQKAGKLFKLSELTLPHELARVVLLEQLYRAHTILKGEKYHH